MSRLDLENREHSLPRVLMAIDLDPTKKFGTLEEEVLALARAFQAQGGRFLPLYERGLDAEAAAKYDAEGLHAAGLDLTRFTLGRLIQLLGLIRRERIEVIHWNFHEPLRNPYLWALSVLRPRLLHVYTDHISRPRDAPPPVPASGWKRAFKRFLAGRYTAVVCVSKFLENRLSIEGIWPRLWLGTHFVNTNRFAPAPTARRRIRDELGVGDSFVALIVAYLIGDKGVDVALRAWPKLPKSARLWIIGDGPESAPLHALADTLGIGDRVRWLGIQRHVEPFLQAADCTLCPSVWAEAAGLVNIEALSTGLPVIASRIGGIPEIVAEEACGFLFPPGDADALADRLLVLINDPALRHAQARAARQTALARFATDVVLPRHLDFYRGLRTPARVV